MPTKPQIKTLTNVSVDVLNAIRNASSTDYRNYVPIATANAEVIRKIGAVIMDNPALQNEFISCLVNRIAKVLVTSKLYSNPWAIFKKGIIDFGETVEEVFVEIAKPFQYDAEVAETNQYKREIPNVRSAFHTLNYQKFYKSTIQQKDLQKAFLSIEGVTDLIGKIIEAMYSASNYDEFLVMKYLLARHLVDGRVTVVPIDAVSATNAKPIVSTIKGISNKMSFLNPNYNIAGVHTKSDKTEQYVLVNSEFDAVMDVEVLATAFNMDKAQFMGQRILVDSFGSLDKARLAELFADDPTYVELTDEELTALDAIPAVIVDANFFMIFDNLLEMREKENGEGLYWNYWLHVWRTFSVSPFAQACGFIPATQEVTSVAVTPTTASAGKGQLVQLKATVETKGFAPQTVTWSTNAQDVTVDANGLVVISATASAGAKVITATSTFDTSKKATATITVVA